MSIRPRVVVFMTAIVAFAVFCAVQERITGQGAQRYVDLQKEALAGRGAAITIDEVMRPAVAQSVREGLLWGGGVLVTGLGVAGALSRRRRRF